MNKKVKSARKIEIFITSEMPAIDQKARILIVHRGEIIAEFTGEIKETNGADGTSYHEVKFMKSKEIARRNIDYQMGGEMIRLNSSAYVIVYMNDRIYVRVNGRIEPMKDADGKLYPGVTLEFMNKM